MNIGLSDAAWEGVEPTVEALLDHWLVQEGDRVHRGQLLAVAVLVKASLDIEAPADGRVARILVGAGQTFRQGQALATLEPVP